MGDAFPDAGFQLGGNFSALTPSRKILTLASTPCPVLVIPPQKPGEWELGKQGSPPTHRSLWCENPWGIPAYLPISPQRLDL